jgi:SAM-dependent methyltransferase
VLRERLEVLYQFRSDAPSVARSRGAGGTGSQLGRVKRRVGGAVDAYQEAVAAVDEVKRIDYLQRRAEATDLPAALRAMRAVSDLRGDVDALFSFRGPLLDRIEGLDQVQQRMQSEAQALPYMSGDPFGVSDEPGIGRVQGYEVSADEDGGAVYRSFEDVFRGSEEFIRERQRRFLPLLREHGPVLDFGCGRGEMLDLLRDEGIEAVGIDSDAGMLDRCRAKGHDNVELVDGIEYLARCEPKSFGAVFCAQVIEHLPYEQLVRFFELSRLVLRDGGVLIAETVNPHSAPALKTFWIDLTHQHPIFPEVTLAIGRAVGFRRAFIFYPNGEGDLESDRFSTGEYAIVAHTAEDAAAATSRR